MQTVIGLGRQARDPGSKPKDEGEKSAKKGKAEAAEEKPKLIPMKQPLSEMILYLSDEEVLFMKLETKSLISIFSTSLIFNHLRATFLLKSMYARLPSRRKL